MSPEEKQARINALVEHYRPYLGLQDWTIKVEFFPNRKAMGEEEDQCAAGCVANPEYESAELAFAVDEMQPGGMDMDVLHEMCHTLNWRLFYLAEWMVEQHDPENAALRKWLQLELESCTTRMERILARLIPRL